MAARSRLKSDFASRSSKSFGEGLHHAVLDAVVDHLDVVAGAAGADVEIAVGFWRREGFEYWEVAVVCCAIAADGEAVSVFESPDSAAGSGVEHVDAFFGQIIGATDRLFVV